MPRYLLILEYDGTPFAGFQAQADQPSVQGRLEEAIFKFTGEKARIHVAGRTDAGVHALGQAAHFDIAKDFSPAVVRDALNAHLVPDPISVIEAREVDPEFHVRFSAKGRRYLYRVIDRKPPPVIDRNRAWWVKTSLNVEAMREASKVLLGHHDFTTFRDSHCQAKSPMRTLDEIEIERLGEDVRFRFSAQSFLHRQVRSMVGTLVQVGTDRWTAAHVEQALRARDRARCGPTAPAHGLYFLGVVYQENLK
jgi:tRNA pseudouridine38-40 synthase